MELIIGIVIGAFALGIVLGYKHGTLQGYIKRAKEFEVSALAAINANPLAQTPKAMSLLHKLESHLSKIAAAAPRDEPPPPQSATGVTPDGALRA